MLAKLSLAVALALAAPAAAQPVQIDIVNHMMAAPVASGRTVTLAVYYIATLKTYFAGCLVSIPGSNGYEIRPPFAHWYADAATDIVEESQSLRGVLAVNGGNANFVLRLMEHGTECRLALNGYAAAAQQSGPFTTRQLIDALAMWHIQATTVPGLDLPWPGGGAPPL